MRWLVTVTETSDLQRLSQVVRSAGGACDQNQAATPLGDGELVIVAEGPTDLEATLRDLPDVIEVYPDSEPVAYQ